MSITGVLIAALIVGGTGVFIGVFLGIAGKKFAVEVDEKEEAILAELPGNNCGGCGYPGIKEKKGNFVVPDQRKDEVFFIGR